MRWRSYNCKNNDPGSPIKSGMTERKKADSSPTAQNDRLGATLGMAAWKNAPASGAMSRRLRAGLRLSVVVEP